jgi:hypothetical protein
MYHYCVGSQTPVATMVIILGAYRVIVAHTKLIFTRKDP